MLRGQRRVGEGLLQRALHRAPAHHGVGGQIRAPAQRHFRWRAAVQIRPARERRRHVIKAQIETDVRAGDRFLVHLHRDHIIPRHQHRGGNRLAVKLRALIRSARAIRQRGAADRAGRHVRAEDFHAIQIDHRAIIPQHIHPQLRQRRRVRDIEVPPEISGDVFRRRTRPVIHHRRLIPVAIPQRGRSALPRRFIKRRPAPRRPRERPGIRVEPVRAFRNEQTLRGQRRRQQRETEQPRCCCGDLRQEAGTKGEGCHGCRM